MPRANDPLALAARVRENFSQMERDLRSRDFFSADRPIPAPVAQAIRARIQRFGEDFEMLVHDLGRKGN